MRVILVSSNVQACLLRSTSVWARYFSEASELSVKPSRSPTALDLVPRRSNLPEPPTSILTAIRKCKAQKARNFDETVDLAVQLGVDPRKPNQSVRGIVSLPNGTGKQVRIAVFARGPKAEEAKAAGATIVGAEDLVEQIQSGKMEFDRCIATPDIMPLVGRIARILGPRGLMPNPKLGTVTQEIGDAIVAARGGQVAFRAEKNGIIHAGVGKLSFSEEALLENVRAFMVALSDAKPEGAKGKYIKAAHVSTTMGPSYSLDIKYLDPALTSFMRFEDVVKSSMLCKQKMTEELRYYVRSERHFQAIQSWLESSKPSFPASVAVSTGASNPVQSIFFPLLKTQELGGVVLYGPSTGSTQMLLREAIKPSAPSGVICYTELQSSGRGRGTNSWSSPQGCLTFSFQSVFTDGTTLPFVQYLVSLAIIKALERVHTAAPGCTNLVKIKWPNDIYANQVKIGGILCQSEYCNGKFSVTTGIGINISNRSPTTCLQDILGIEEHPCTLTKEHFLAAFCNVYEPMEKLFLEQGFEPFMEEYLARWLHTDQVVQVASSDDAGGRKVPAVIKGLTSTGCLLAKGDDGSSLELYPDGNSFDFLTGLLKRKL
ncbi:putative ribosomal protein L1 [Plasmopara halstedii]